MSRLQVVDQKVFDDAVLTATVGLNLEFAVCPSKVVEIITTGFTGTLDIKGAIGAGVSKDNASYIRMGQDGGQSPVNDQLSYTTDTGRYRYLILEPYAFMDFVMTRSAGSVTVHVYGMGGGVSAYPFDGAFGDDVELKFGGSYASPKVAVVYDTVDPNANHLKFSMAAGGDGSHVPVVSFGVDINDVDLTFWNGRTEPLITVVDANRDSWVGIGFNADDEPEILIGGAATILKLPATQVTELTIRLAENFLYLTESDQTDPAGRWRFRLDGDIVFFERATSASWAADEDWLTFDKGNEVIKLEKNTRVVDDAVFAVGTSSDGVMYLCSAGLTADTVLAGVLIGTPVSPVIPTDSFLIANITADGDILIVVNDGGTSWVGIHLDADVGVMYLTPVTGGLTIGLAADAPAPDQADSVLIWVSDSGDTAAVTNTLLTLEKSDTTYISFLSPTSGGLIFGDVGDDDAGRIIYTHADDSFEIWTAGVQRLDYKETTLAFLESTIVSSTGVLTINAFTTGGIISIGDAFAINTGMSDDDYFTIGAVDNDPNTITELMRFVGAASPYAKFTGAVFMAEITTPTAVGSHGALYPKSNDRLYFQDGAGNEHEIVEVDVEHAEMFMDGNGTPAAITTVNDPVALEGFSSSHLQDFTFVSSKNGVIADTESNGGTLRITDVGHGLVTGDVVTINGLATAAQNGVTVITRITDDVFDCDDISWVTDDETGTWQMGSYLLVPTGGAGTYMAAMSSSTTADGANKTYLVEVLINSTVQADMKVERKFSAADIGSVGMSGLLTLADGNRIWLCCTGLTDATEITFKHANLVVHRI